MTALYCADCAVEQDVDVRPIVVMVAMRPGVDRQPWHVCVPCYCASTKDEPIAASKGRR